MADSKSKPESSVSSKEIAKGSEEVLIEIDGKFELVSAADMQANQPTDPKHSEASTIQYQKTEELGRKNQQQVYSDDPENYDDDFEDDSRSNYSSSPAVEHDKKTAVQHTPQHSPQADNETDSEQFTSKPTVSEEPSTVKEKAIGTAVQEKTSIQERPISGTTRPRASSSSKGTKKAAKDQDATSGSQTDLKHSQSSQADSRQSQTDLRRSPAGSRRLQSDLKRSQSDLTQSQTDLRRLQTDSRRSQSQSQTDPRRSQSDLRRSQSDLRRSQSDLRQSQTDLGLQRSSVEIVVSEHNTLSSNKSNIRTKSAPGSRSTVTQPWEEDEMERKQRCESAFKAWLARKNAQIAEERKLQRANAKVMTKEDILQKIEQSETAYKAWLENKNRQVQERRYHQRAIKSANAGIPKEAKAQQSAAAFRGWLEQKQMQRQKEREMQIRRVKEEAELARTVDTSLANHAYRR